MEIITNNENLFEALKNGIWYIEEDEILFSKDVKVYYDDSLKDYRLIIENHTYLRVIDYTNTWALTKEELKND